MKRESKVALFLSGSVMVTGMGLAALPLMESALSRIINRAEAAPNAPVISDFAPPGAVMAQIAPMKGNFGTMGGANLSLNTPMLTPTDTPGRVAPRFAVLDLSSLPNGAGFEPADLNNRGDIVGNYRVTTPVEEPEGAPGEKRRPKYYRVTTRPAVFRAGKVEPLPVPPGYNWVYASSVNDSGQVVGAARQLDDIPTQRGALVGLALPRILRWDSAGMADLTADFARHPQLTADLKTSRFILAFGDPIFVKNDGTIYAGFNGLYRWRGDTATRFDAGFVRQVNERGTMIGAVPNRNTLPKMDGPMVGPIMGPGGILILQPGLVDTETGKETPLGRFSDEPSAINDAGVTVLRGNRNGGVTQYSIWRGDKPVPVATLPPSRGCLINNNGWIVMGDGMPEGLRVGTKGNPMVGPFLRTSTGYYWLTALLNEPDAWVLSNVVAMNERNQIVVYGYRAGEERRRALLLTPVK